MLQLPAIEANRLFDVDTVTRKEIVDLIRLWGNDNGGRYIKALLLQIANLKGFAPITVLDINPDRTYAWEVRPYDYYADAQKAVAGDSIANVERSVYLGPNLSNRGQAYYVLSWIGQRPSDDDVRKKMKQHGAKFQ